MYTKLQYLTALTLCLSYKSSFAISYRVNFKICCLGVLIVLSFEQNEWRSFGDFSSANESIYGTHEELIESSSFSAIFSVTSGTQISFIELLSL